MLIYIYIYIYIYLYYILLLNFYLESKLIVVGGLMIGTSKFKGALMKPESRLKGL